jgi:hypothetical protein
MTQPSECRELGFNTIQKLVIIISFPILFSLVGYGMYLAYSTEGSSMSEYRGHILKAVQDPKVECSYLTFVTKVVGNGLWSLDSTENQIHNIAQNKLDKGDCK